MINDIPRSDMLAVLPSTPDVEGFSTTESQPFKDLPKSGRSDAPEAENLQFRLMTRDAMLKLNDSIYESHPISSKSVLDAVKRDGYKGVTQAELQKYDTNTVGGTGVVLAMAHALEIKPGDEIVDVGAGIGGPIRTILSEIQGTTATGIDPSVSRVEGAILLNERTGMDDRIKMLQGFSGEHDVKGNVVTAFDVAGHLGTPEQAIGELMKHARSGARIGLTLQCVSSDMTEGQRQKFEYVRATWGGHLYTMDEWQKAIATVATGEPQAIPTPGASEHLAVEIAHAKGVVSLDSPEILSRERAKDLVDQGKLMFLGLAFELKK
jgi:2-polyprenyl-3-methyl-5-hydroxy-6-metoxy-1,4-benzoquinol methylase